MPPILPYTTAGAAPGNLAGWAAAIVNAQPNGAYGSLAGEWHGVPAEDLAQVLIEFFQA